MGHRLAPQALSDLDELWAFVAEHASLETADALVDSIARRFLLLATYPHSGRRRPDLSAGLRSFTVGEHVILYRIADRDVLILRVVRGSRDIEGLRLE